MFLSWNLECVELIYCAPHKPYIANLKNVILELITDAWAIDMQANAVINAV